MERGKNNSLEEEEEGKIEDKKSFHVVDIVPFLARAGRNERGEIKGNNVMLISAGNRCFPALRSEEAA